MSLFLVRALRPVYDAELDRGLQYRLRRNGRSAVEWLLRFLSLLASRMVLEQVL